MSILENILSLLQLFFVSEQSEGLFISKFIGAVGKILENNPGSYLIKQKKTWVSYFMSYINKKDMEHKAIANAFQAVARILKNLYKETDIDMGFICKVILDLKTFIERQPFLSNTEVILVDITKVVMVIFENEKVDFANNILIKDSKKMLYYFVSKLET